MPCKINVPATTLNTIKGTLSQYVETNAIMASIKQELKLLSSYGDASRSGLRLDIIPADVPELDFDC